MEPSLIERLAAYAQAAFPPGTAWSKPEGYPNSLALCVLDSIWSLGVNYDHHVVPVLNRYRELAASEGRDPDRDSPCDLAATIAKAGGPTSFADAVKSRHRTSSVNGILKADAVNQAAELLCAKGILTSADVAVRQADIKAEWLRVRGQGSGISWRYFLMLAGVDGIKPDRMIRRFIEHATGAVVSDQEAVDLLTSVQQTWPDPKPTLSELDHAIWRRQSGRG